MEKNNKKKISYNATKHCMTLDKFMENKDELEKPDKHKQQPK
jgi:hypothetical protein